MELQEIKQYLFARRNGIAADALRKGGSGFATIFGVDVPSIKALAAEIGFDSDLAARLWADCKVRESHLLAPWIIDPASASVDLCMQMAASTIDREDAQMLAFRLLKRHPDANEILNRLNKEATSDGSLAWSRDALTLHLS